MIDAVALTAALIRCRSVTPADDGALGVLGAALRGAGFSLTPLPFGPPDGPAIQNLFARAGTGGPHFAFAGHTDVVPPGDEALWSSSPFEAAHKDGALIGRGAVDMKGAVAAFAAAAAEFIAQRPDFGGSISLIITGDEEGVADYGTKPMLEWLKANRQLPDVCLVGEPSSQQVLGDCFRVGRRGTLAAQLRVRGRQGHTAYPERADNPLPRLTALLHHLAQWKMDDGSEDFAPSLCVLTSVDVGNPASNIIPAHALARWHIRFNTAWSRAALEAELHKQCARFLGADYELRCQGHGEAFIIPDSPFRTLVSAAIQHVTGRVPVPSTGGGTSDARFITHYCPVVEFGLVGQTMHQTDERVSLADLAQLQATYHEILRRFFDRAA